MTDVSISKPSVITTGDADFAEQAPGQAGTSTLPQSIGEAPPPTSGDVNFKLAGIQVDISEKQVPMIMLAMSSSISLMAVSFGVDEDHRYYSYALSSGAVALSLSAVGLLLSWKKEWDKGSLSRYVSGMCFVWTFIAATILTFGDGPFVNTGNGYFATWAMVIFSTQSLVSSCIENMNDSDVFGTTNNEIPHNVCNFFLAGYHCSTNEGIGVRWFVVAGSWISVGCV